MKERMPATFSVAIGGAFLYLTLGIPIGVAAARRRGTVADKALVSSFLVVSSIPYYLFALLTWLFLTISWEIPFFSDTGYFPITENPAKWFSGMLLAWLALGAFGCTTYTRYSRGSMVEVLNEDYIRTAKAKGLRDNTVVYKHACGPRWCPSSRSSASTSARCSPVRSSPSGSSTSTASGCGALQAVDQRDLPVVAATALFGAAVLIISNIVVDVIYSVLDPRVRLS